MSRNYLRLVIDSTLRQLSQRALLSWLFLLIGLAISALAYLTSTNLIKKEEQARLGALVEQGSSAIKNHLHANSEVVRGLQSHFMSSAVDDRRIFRHYYQSLDLEQRYPGLQALTFSRWVLPEQLGDFISKTRADRSLDPAGNPDFAIKPEGKRAFYCIVDLVEPPASNQKAFGFDLCSENERRTMVKQARDSGKLTASGPLNLFVHDPNVTGYILAMPVYRRGALLDSLEQRRTAFLGVVTGVYRYQDVIAGALGESFLKEADVRVHDFSAHSDTGPGELRQIFGASGATAIFTSGSTTGHAVIEFDGRRWQISFSPRNSFHLFSARWLPALVLSIGLLITLSVFGVLRLLLVLGRRAEQRALQSEQRLEAIVNSLPEVIWSISLPERKLVYLSPAAARLLGRVPPERSGPVWQSEPSGIGPNFQDYLAPEDQLVLAAWFDGLLAGNANAVEVRIMRGEGALRWLELTGHVVYDEQGAPLRMDGIATDISERLATESQVRKLSGVVDQSPASVVITDTSGRIEYVNPHYCAVTGYTQQEVLGQTPHIHASGRTPDAVYQQLWQTILAGGVWQGELLNKRKNGELFWELEVIAPVFDVKGNICNFVAIKEDISEQKRAQEELQRINRTLRVLSRCNGVLVRAASENELLEAMCDVLLEGGGYQLVWIGQPQPDHAVRVAAQRGFDTAALAAAIASVRWDDSLYGSGPAGRALRSASIVVERELDGPEQAPWVVIQRETGIRVIASLPLQSGGELLGVLTLFSTDREAFDHAEIALLAELADDIAYGLANLRSERARQAQQSELRLLQRAMDASSDAIMVSDHRLSHTPLVYVNHAFERITGFTASEVLGHSAGFLHASDSEQSARLALDTAIQAGHEARVELRTYHKDGQPFWSELAVAPVRDADDQVSHVIGVLTDISERKQWEAQLEYQATHDALTGLPNRLLLTDRAQRAILRARREESCMALMLLDLDRFKLVNDSLGHEVGDTLLKGIATRLTSRIREGDTVARLGGDEFVVVANVQDEHGAASLALTLMQAISEAVIIEGQSIYPSCSLGVSMFPRDGEEMLTLLRNADAAMYRAKADGSNYPQFYAQNLTVSTGRRLQLESALRQALEQDQLRLHFQPKVQLSTGTLVGAEVLLRWQHPDFGTVSPVEFIPIAEDTGLILSIGDWVLRQTCQQIAQWQAMELPVVPLAVNLSARQFSAPDLVEQIARILRETGVDASLLHLELTESILVHRPEAAAAMLLRLRGLGIKLALDDFGTGFSSLNYLRRFPINLLKIDQSFVRELVQESGSATIAVAIIQLAHSLRMQVVAEGVETEAQLQFLRRHGCDQVQGYLTGRPVPAQEFQALLERPGRMIAPEDAGAHKRTLLLLDDEPGILSALRRVFAHQGYHVLATTSANEALELLALHQVGVILSDQRMPEMSGTAFFRRVKQSYPDTVRMILSGYTDLDTLAGAINEGAIYKFLTKPWENEQLREQVRDAFRYHELMQDKGETPAEN